MTKQEIINCQNLEHSLSEAILRFKLDKIFLLTDKNTHQQSWKVWQASWSVRGSAVEVSKARLSQRSMVGQTTFLPSASA